MKLKKGFVYLPKSRKDGKVKYLCICAYPSDCETMSIDGIQRGYRAQKYTFSCVSTSNLAADGKTNLSESQKKAAEIGRYNALYFLKYKHEEIKDQENQDLIKDYVAIIKELKPRIIYTHSLLDSDPVHVAVAVKVLNALRTMRRYQHPKVIYGCESSRDLDWVKSDKVVCFDNSKNLKLQKQLISVYKDKNDNSYIVEATVGRRFVNGLNNKEYKLSTRAINMTTLLRRKELTIKKFAMGFVDDLYSEISDSMDRSL